MKRTFLLLMAIFTLLTSCNNESIPTISQENQKTEAIQNFKRALISLNKPENLPTAEEKRASDFPQLNERRKDLLVPAAKGLIKSTGVKDEQIQKNTNGDKAILIKWAMNIFRDNYNNSSLQND